MSLGPSWSPSRTPTMYVGAFSDSTAKAFYGTRYVISTLKQRTLGLDTRLNVTFSPTMSLELYMQPFFAAAHFYDYKEYVAPRTDVTATYGKDRGTIDATPVPFDESYRLCAQCHPARARDWEHGLHGLQTGAWAGERRRRNCTACHDPHDPHRPAFQALPPPARDSADRPRGRRSGWKSSPRRPRAWWPRL